MNHSTVININGERMVWEYPDISYSQIHYLATGKWRQINPELNVSYTRKRTNDAGTLRPDEVLKVHLDGSELMITALPRK